MSWFKRKKIDAKRGSFLLTTDGTKRTQSEGEDGTDISAILMAMATLAGSASLDDISVQSRVNRAKVERLLPVMASRGLIEQSKEVSTSYFD